MTTLTARIRDKFDALSNNERVLAQAILEFPGDVAGYTATELAEIAGVSKMTVTRLVRRLGFASYDQARIASREINALGSPFHQLRSDKRSKASRPEMQHHLLQCLENVEATARTIDPAIFARAVDLLAKAPRVWVVGFRNSANLASYARWQLTQLRPNVHLNAQSVETLGETLADIAPSDLLLAIGTRRRPDVFPRFVEAAQASGAALIYLGDAHSSVGVSMPELSLVCMTKSLVPLDNHVAVLAVIHALAAGLYQRIGRKARKRLQRVSAFQERLGEI